MKLRFLGSRNPSAVFRFSSGDNISTEIEVKDNTIPLESDEENESVDDGIPDDMGNRLPSGGRSGNPKTDKFQGYKIPPMY